MTLPPYAHDWDQRKDVCRKCRMTMVHYYENDRPICEKQRVVSLLDDRTLESLESDLRERGLL